ncbi:GSCOCG00011402001-RA-CDS [Cotesia congregata]|nr:GSCOCG00011402001-RA-CDS [Cotesia congregata]
MNTFLEPFVKKLQKCFNDGIKWIHPKTGEEIVSRIVVPLIIADAPARAELQNVVNFNGRYGCNICEIKSRKCSVVAGKRRVRVYQYKEAKLRTKNRIKHQVIKVMNSDKNHIKGIKENSSVAELPLIDVSSCFIPEYMHSVLLGVDRQFASLWTEKKGPWKLKKELIIKIDSFLENIRPPYFFGRMPRKLTLFKHFKASEFYNWTLFYSLPALNGYLQLQYLDHWMLLVKGLFILLKTTITKEDMNEAEYLFSSFVEEIETLYSDRELTYNSHQLRHLVLCVRRWGPLWGTAAFCFESFNGYIEIINHLTEVQALQLLKSKIIEKNSDPSVEVTSHQVIGKSIDKIILTGNDQQLLRNYGFEIKNLKIFARAKILNEIYTSEIYKIIKTNSQTVQIEFKNSTTVYGSIKLFFLTEDNLLYFILDKYIEDNGKYFVHSTKLVQVDHIIPFTKINSSLLINCNQIKNIFHVIVVGNYLCQRPNMLRKIF